MKEQAEKLVSDFVGEILVGDWEQLKNFDFRTLQDSEKYGSPDRHFDCDDTSIMRAIYVVLWHDSFPYLNLSNFGSCKQYRGDTMNTFHTMFGREKEERRGFYDGLEKYNPSDELRQKARKFNRLCSNIGNYVVLPNFFAEQTSINCYRGTNDWRDFFDRFLQELYKVLTDSANQDETLKKLVKVNEFGFRNFQGKAGFKKFIKTLFLEDYCDDSGVPQNVFAVNFHWKDIQNREQYLHDAELYLTQTEKIITNRADRIISSLKNALS